MSALSHPKFLMPSISLVSYPIPPCPVLVDSSSCDCFINNDFVNTHECSTNVMPPLQLCLFNGTSNSTITQAINLSIDFTTDDITSLAPSYSLLLGHNWLTCHNPLIDWVSSSISFHVPEQSFPASPSTPLQPPELLPPAEPTPSDPPYFFNHKALPTALISVPAFIMVCCRKGSIELMKEENMTRKQQHCWHSI